MWQTEDTRQKAGSWRCFGNGYFLSLLSNPFIMKMKIETKTWYSPENYSWKHSSNTYTVISEFEKQVTLGQDDQRLNNTVDCLFSSKSCTFMRFCGAMRCVYVLTLEKKSESLTVWSSSWHSSKWNLTLDRVDVLYIGTITVFSSFFVRLFVFFLFVV